MTFRPPSVLRRTTSCLTIACAFAALEGCTLAIALESHWLDISWECSEPTNREQRWHVHVPADATAVRLAFSGDRGAGLAVLRVVDARGHERLCRAVAASAWTESSQFPVVPGDWQISLRTDSFCGSARVGFVAHTRPACVRFEGRP